MALWLVSDAVSDKARLNAVRGLACLLLVINHSADTAIQHSVGAAIDMVGKDQLILGIFRDAAAPIRMPLFSMLSGFIYALRPVERSSWSSFVAKKFWRIVVPYVAITILLLLAKDVMGPSEPCSLECTIAYLYLPYEHLWFLQAIFGVFVTVGLIDSFTASRRWAGLVMIGLACVAFFSPLRNITIFSIGQAFYLAPFFLAGVVLYRFRSEMTAHAARIIPVLLVIAAIFLVWHIVMLVDDIPTSRRDIVALMLGLSGCSLLLLLFPRIGLLTRIGVYSYAIYLFHLAFGSIANRMTTNMLPLMVLSILLGIAGPIAIELGIKRFAPMLGFLIGIRPRRFWPGRRVPAAATVTADQ